MISLFQLELHCRWAKEKSKSHRKFAATFKVQLATATAI